MDEVVAVLQDLFTVPGEDSAHLAQAADAKAAADADGATHVTPLVRRVLGSDAEVFRRAPHWRGAAPPRCPAVVLLRACAAVGRLWWALAVQVCWRTSTESAAATSWTS